MKFQCNIAAFAFTLILSSVAGALTRRESFLQVPDNIARKTASSDENINRGINWVPSHEDEFPFLVQAHIYYKEESNYMYSQCGGSIISTKVILTAAHCFIEHMLAFGALKPDFVRVLLGQFSREQESTSNQRAPTDVKIHDAYSEGRYGEHINDIALLFFENSLLEVDSAPGKVGTICVDTSAIGSDVEVSVAGWGVTSVDGPLANAVRKSSGTITMTNEQCTKTGYIEKMITDNMLCARGFGPSGIEDSCQGDSGGPMFRKLDGNWTQVGVVSWGIGCGYAMFPGVYTRLSEFIEFIKQESAAKQIDDICYK